MCAHRTVIFCGDYSVTSEFVLLFASVCRVSSVSVQEDDQIKAQLKQAQDAIDGIKNKLQTRETEMDWMSFAREEALSAKREELEHR